MKLNIEIDESHLTENGLLLNTLLADEYVICTKTRNAHWNIQGQNFLELHKFFETQYDALNIIIDDIAERVRALGQVALGSLKDIIAQTRLNENNNDVADHNHIIQSLLEDHEALIRSLRKDITTTAEHRDLGTADFMTGLLEQHEKMSWMLRAHLS